MKVFVLIHKEIDGGYWGECPELPGCFSQGENVDELMSNMDDAVRLYLKDSPGFIDSVTEIRELEYA
ncbi:hypothetical protein AGMMS49957_06700 [Synergistales bacterium]|nr:hypothetical protein AGMMS49957_06700 [Synergistales bacterium]